jgi:tricorn protease-like protein
MLYLSWHPSGRLLAFSANKLSLFNHTIGETRDVYDAQSDIGIYRVDSNLTVYPPPISLTNRNETWPNWSPDGRYLYYSAADPKPLEQFRKIRYDLMRVSYDIDHDRWGEPEMLVSSQETGLSACEPRVSPDGRFVMFCLCNYGNFPIYQTNTDLYLLDVAARKFRRLEINSPQADSWHCWSSNGRWVVFSSKRLDGLFARPFFTHMDQNGEFSKPFLLPQQDPDFYDSFLQTFNLPEFVLGPVQVTQDQLAHAFMNPSRALVPRMASSKINSPDASQDGGGGESAYRAPTK